MKERTKYLIGIYMISIMTFGQSAHYIQAWKIFTRQSASDVSLLSYSICSILLLHSLGYAILIKKRLLILAEGVGLIGSGIVITGIMLYG